MRTFSTIVVTIPKNNTSILECDILQMQFNFSIFSIYFSIKGEEFGFDFATHTVPSRLQGSILRSTSTVYPTQSETVQNGSKRFTIFFTQFINQLTQNDHSTPFSNRKIRKKMKNCIKHRMNSSYPSSRKR